jgi:hypothetical protein
VDAANLTRSRNGGSRVSHLAGGDIALSARQTESTTDDVSVTESTSTGNPSPMSGLLRAVLAAQRGASEVCGTGRSPSFAQPTTADLRTPWEVATNGANGAEALH